MRNICLFFQIHIPVQLKRYRFFDIGQDHYYYDDFQNEEKIRFLVEQSYVPALQTIREMVRSSNAKFKCAFAISGVTLEQLEHYAPEVIDLLKELANTGSIEFLSETYAHSLASLHDEEEFSRQIKLHAEKIKSLFNKTCSTFFNAELIYSDEIGARTANEGLKASIIDEAKYIMGWKSPNYIYKHAFLPKHKIIVRNHKLSDDLAFRFTQLSLTAEKFVASINALPAEQNTISLGMGLEVFGITNPAFTGIFDFLKALPYHAMEQGLGFVLPSEACKKQEAIDTLTIPYPMSWVGNDKDISAWQGNDLQQEALRKLYAVSERVNLCTDRPLKQDWLLLQSTDHFRYMSHKDAYGTHYESAYEAFMNYMNVLSDFLVRVDAQYPSTIENEELNELLKTINNQELEIEELQETVKKLRSKKKVE